jgi:hypothetical protein
MSSLNSGVKGGQPKQLEVASLNPNERLTTLSGQTRATKASINRAYEDAEKESKYTYLRQNEIVIPLSPKQTPTTTDPTDSTEKNEAPLHISDFDMNILSRSNNKINSIVPVSAEKVDVEVTAKSAGKPLATASSTKQTKNHPRETSASSTSPSQISTQIRDLHGSLSSLAGGSLSNLRRTTGLRGNNPNSYRDNYGSLHDIMSGTVTPGGLSSTTSKGRFRSQLGKLFSIYFYLLIIISRPP